VLRVIIFSLLVVSTFSFVLTRVLSDGDASEVILGTDATPARVAQLNDALGLNKPLDREYLDWHVGLLKGDLGRGWYDRESINAKVRARAGVTGEIVVLASVVAGVLSVAYIWGDSAGSA